VVSNDALLIVSGERGNKLEDYARSDELMAVRQLHRTPAYSCDPVAVTPEHCHLTADSHFIGVGLLLHSCRPPYAHSHVIRARHEACSQWVCLDLVDLSVVSPIELLVSVYHKSWRRVPHVRIATGSARLTLNT
jgi:hypothetical protein